MDLDGVPLKGFLDCLQECDYIVRLQVLPWSFVNKFRYDVNGTSSYDIQAYIYTKVFGVTGLLLGGAREGITHTSLPK